MPSSEHPPRGNESLPERVRDALHVARSKFEARFSRLPTVAAMAPGRVNVIGEHTDYNGGFVLPIAIERETIIVADDAAGGRSTIVAADLGEEAEVNLHLPLTSQQDIAVNHMLGVAAQFQQRGFLLPNLDMLVTSSVPMGSGLSSSAALEVACALVLNERTNAAMPHLALARLCQSAEQTFAGVPCGIMDMYTSLHAQKNRALLLDCTSMHARSVPADWAANGAVMLVVDTGVKHALASSAYADRRATCEAAARVLGMTSLRKATIESLNTHGLTSEQQKRALHVIAENTRTILAAEALATGELHRVGALMLQSHASLRDLYEVSCTELDVLVDAAAGMRDRDEGVHGARMTGGGFGGCVIVLCAAGALQRVESTLRNAFAGQFRREPAQMFTTSAAGGARSLSHALRG